MSYGIPLMYYGTEALFKGAHDPNNREVFDPLITHQHLLDREFIKYIKTLNDFRREHQTYLADMSPDWRNVESNVLTFTKGDDIFVVLVNN